MTTSLVDQTTVKLHTSSDRLVWFSDGIRLPVCSGLRVAEFVAALLEQPGVVHARLAGTQQNAQLITLLHQQARPDDTLEVVSPLLCDAHRNHMPPERVLQQMRLCQLPASRGGWHRLTALDASAYALVYQLQQDNHFSERVGSHLRAHAAWGPLSFIERVQPAHAAWLLSFIVDPRWFIDQRHPHRTAKLRSYLGLTPAIVRLALTSDISADSLLPPVVGRCRAVIGTWWQSRPAPVEMDLPGNFLWRVYASTGDHFKGMLRACQQLISYLRNSWLALLTNRGELFTPEYFFKNSVEIEAYQAHMAGWSRSV